LIKAPKSSPESIGFNQEFISGFVRELNSRGYIVFHSPAEGEALLAYFLHAGLLDLISTADTDSIILASMLGDDWEDKGLIYDLNYMTGHCKFLSCHDIAVPHNLFKDSELYDAWLKFTYKPIPGTCDCQCLAKRCEQTCSRCGTRHLTDWVRCDSSEGNKKKQHLRILPMTTRSRKRQREDATTRTIEPISSLFYFLVGYGCLTGTDYGKINGKGPAKIDRISDLVEHPKFMELLRCYKFAVVVDKDSNMATLMKPTDEEDRLHVTQTVQSIPVSYSATCKREKMYRLGSASNIPESITKDVLPFCQISNPEEATNDELKYFISCRNSYTFESTKAGNLELVRNIIEIEKMGHAQLVDPDGRSALFYLQNLNTVCKAASK